jgi:hypothetical protein
MSDLDIDYASMAYGPHAQGGDADCASWEDRVLESAAFRDQTGAQGRDLRCRVQWEHRNCEEPRTATRADGRDWVWEQVLKLRHRTAADPGSGCAGCPLSYHGVIDSDKSLQAARGPSPSRMPDLETRRRDVEAHRWKPAPPPARGKPAKTTVPERASNRRKRRGRKK